MDRFGKASMNAQNSQTIEHSSAVEIRKSKITRERRLRLGYELKAKGITNYISETSCIEKKQTIRELAVGMAEMRTGMQQLFERTDILANTKGTPMTTMSTATSSGYGSSKMEPQVSSLITTGQLNYGVMAQDLRARLAAKDCKHFKARDYHELDTLLEVYNSVGYLPEPAVTKLRNRIHLFFVVSKAGWEKALRFFEERELVNHAGYIPQRDAAGGLPHVLEAERIDLRERAQAQRAECDFREMARLPPGVRKDLLTNILQPTTDHPKRIHRWEFGRPVTRKYFWDDQTNKYFFVESGGYEDIPEESEEDLENQDPEQQGTGDDPEEAASGSSSEATTPTTTDPSQLSSPSNDMSIRFFPIKLATGEEPVRIEVDSYFNPATSIQQFNKIFPVLKALFRKLKNGLRIWTKGGCARTQGYRHKIAASDKKRDLVISSLLRAKIIEPVPLKKVPRFCGTFFLVRRPGSKVRPIADFSSLTKCIEAPKFALKSLYQVATDTQWPRHLWYVKLDFKQAFFNVELHPKSKFVTTFGYAQSPKKR
ncbi:hypothetical protein BpHYR1_000672 [Brachionus plicatilis]|uniref:Reverse transcriptase domain-containing protein n=1 Tax=Brachionus plicatilis TaxID=10195 RepID=A0A3M7PRQ5_BRAPC|nr:hypothetical protein BpHYR1_000672 [Brachionus plicatilis]